MFFTRYHHFTPTGLGLQKDPLGAGLFSSFETLNRLSEFPVRQLSAHHVADAVLPGPDRLGIDQFPPVQSHVVEGIGGAVEVDGSPVFISQECVMSGSPKRPLLPEINTRVDLGT